MSAVVSSQRKGQLGHNVNHLHLVTRLSACPGQELPFLPFALWWKPGHSDDTPATKILSL